jgi:hypothetical protein
MTAALRLSGPRVRRLQTGAAPGVIDFVAAFGHMKRSQPRKQE